MRRPLPPELVALGDQLESAARRALGRRRTRRQLVLNALASFLVALPVALSLAGSPNPAPVAPSPALLGPVVDQGVLPSPDAVPPRLLRRLERSPDSALLFLPLDLRRALR